ncbi:hypothetical protein [Tangfeifania diversioriginum]|nr:hypothetical protein [Tangfeifania diversioriginum]
MNFNNDSLFPAGSLHLCLPARLVRRGSKDEAENSRLIFIFNLHFHKT